MRAAGGEPPSSASKPLLQDNKAALHSRAVTWPASSGTNARTCLGDVMVAGERHVTVEPQKVAYFEAEQGSGNVNGGHQGPILSRCICQSGLL